MGGLILWCNDGNVVWRERWILLDGGRGSWGPFRGGTPAVPIMAMSANKVLYSTSLPRTVWMKLFFDPVHTDCTASIFIHMKLISFVPCSGLNANQDRKRKRCLCMRRLSAMGCLHHYFKHVPKMNTQTAALHHQSFSQPPLLCVDGGSVWCHTLWSSMWLTVRLYKTTIFLRFITRFPENSNNNNQCLCLILIICLIDSPFFRLFFSSLLIFVLLLLLHHLLFFSHLQIREIHQFRLDHDKTEWPFHIDDNCVLHKLLSRLFAIEMKGVGYLTVWQSALFHNARIQNDDSTDWKLLMHEIKETEQVTY